MIDNKQTGTQKFLQMLNNKLTFVRVSKNGQELHDIKNNIKVCYYINHEERLQTVIQIRTIKDNYYVKSWGAETGQDNDDILMFFARHKSTISTIERQEEKIQVAMAKDFLK